MSTATLATSSSYSSDAWHAASEHTAPIKDEQLLALFADQIAHLAQFNWYRAERFAIDQHALSQLVLAKGVAIEQSELSLVEQKLSNFINEEIQPLWDELELLSHDEKHQQALRLVEQLAEQVFGDSAREREASWILYYSLPQLPFFAMDNAAIKAVKKSDGTAVNIDSYAQFHHCCRRRLSRLLPYIHASAPAPSQEVEQRTKSSNWWQRQCLRNFLTQRA